MKRQEMILYLKQRVPSLRIESRDGFGTLHSPHWLNCVVDSRDVPVLKKCAADINKKASEVCCSSDYGHHLVIPLF